MIFEPLGRYSAPPGYRGAGDTSEKILTLAVVRQGPDVIGKSVSDRMLPHNCPPVAMRCGGREPVSRGDTMIMAGGMLVALANAGDHAGMKEQLQSCCS